MGDLRAAENHQGGGGDKGRMQALRQRDAVQREDHQAPAGHADDGAEHRLLREFHRHMPERAGPA